MADARNAALVALEKCRRSQAWSDAILGTIMDREGLHGKERSFATILCYGVIQNRILLDYFIDTVSTVSFNHIEPKILDILRISAYQILFLDRVPVPVAVSEGVRLCKVCGAARASGFVNAVLRKLANDTPTLPDDNSPETLSIRFSHPLWLVQLYINRLGIDETTSLLRIQNSTTPITLQVNTLRTDTVSLYLELQDAGLSIERHPYLPDCLLLQRGGNIQKLSAFQNGLFYVQDAAAKMAVMAAAPRPGMKILDVCAAPGGKSFAAAILGEKVSILSCDIHENKLKRIHEGADRLGLYQISTAPFDARHFQQDFHERFDLVIADVPCSGLGVIRKKPDIRYKDPVDFSSFPEIQSTILKNVSRYVAPDGVLLYSTCTVRKEENEEVVSSFMADDERFESVDFELPYVGWSSLGMMQLWPHRHETDGFFIAKMRRRR